VYVAATCVCELLRTMLIVQPMSPATTSTPITT